jgi:hypothetical protein
MLRRQSETPGYPNKFLRKNQGEPGVKMTECRSTNYGWKSNVFEDNVGTRRFRKPA